MTRRAIASKALCIGTISLVALLGSVPATLGAEPPCRVRNVTRDTSGRSLVRMVEQAVDGDRLRVRGTCPGPIVIDVDIVIRGEGARPTVTGLDEFSNAPTPLIWVRRHTRAVLRDLTVERSYSEGAAAIEVRPTARVRLVRSVVQDSRNAEGNAGGVSNSGRLILLESIVRRNVAPDPDRYCDGYGGGIAQSSAHLTIKRSRIVDNETGCRGGGIYFAGGTMTVIDSTVSGNHAESAPPGDWRGQGGGGGIYVYADSSDQGITLSGSSITGNSAGSPGGGIFVHPISEAAVTIASTTITGNTPDDCVGTPAC